MKTTTLNNQELVIQARNEADFKAAQKVAELVVAQFPEMADIAAECEHEMFVHICFCDMPYNAKEVRDAYNEAKKAI